MGRLKEIHEDEAETSPRKCPTCNATPGKPCRSTSVNDLGQQPFRRTIHAARWRQEHLPAPKKRTPF